MEYKKKIHLIVLIGIVLVILVDGYLAFAREMTEIDEKNLHDEYQIAKIYEQEKEKIETLYQSFLTAKLTGPRFFDLVENHRDREILAYLAPLYTHLKMTDTSLHAIRLLGTDGKEWLRINGSATQNSSRELPAPYIKTSLSDNVSLSGFHPFKEGLFFSIVYPLFYQGKILGVIELIIDVQRFTHQFDEIMEGQSALFIDKRYLDQQPGITVRDGRILSPDLEALTSLPESFDATEDNRDIRIGEKTYHLHTNQAIPDHFGHPLGSFLLLIDKSADVQNRFHYLLFATFITLLLLGGIFFFSNLMLGRIVKKIDEKQRDIERLNEALSHIAEEKTRELDKNISLLQSYKRAVDNSNIVSKTDPRGIITYVNKEFMRVSGYTKEELIGRPHNIIRHPDMPAEAFRDLWETIQNRRVWKGIVKNRKKDGGYYIVDTIITPVTDNQGDIREYIAIRHDVTDLMRQKEELREIKTDSLTGLANKNALKDTLTEDRDHLLAILSIDNYKEIKDFYGVDAADGVIRSVAKNIKLFFLTYGFTTYKITAEQFALYSGDIRAKESIIREIQNFIAQTTNKAVTYNFYEVYLDFTAGIASGNDGASLFKNADLALKEARYKHIDLYFYDNQIGLLEMYESNIHWTSKLKKAIASDNLVTFYQPIVNNATLRYEKFECLIRMIDEDGSVVTPFFFLNMAKHSKLYPHITRTVIAQSVAVFKETDREFSINITADDIHNKQTVEFLEHALLDNGLAARCVLEITESEEIKDYRRVVHFIKQFKGYGCKIAIDDFGSGYSNFNYIADLDADYIKIDGSLIKNIDRDATSELIVKTIITFARHMGIKTVAEFVSSREIFEKVRELGIDYSQGYYFAAPQKKLLLEPESAQESS